MRKCSFLILFVFGFYIQATPQPLFNSKRLIFQDTFDGKLDEMNWSADINEDSNHSLVSVKNGVLDIETDDGFTLWFKNELSDAWMIEFDRTVLLEGGRYDRLADFNVFWQATDPSGILPFPRKPFFQNYDSLNLYYVGFGGNKNTTTRFRKYKGEGHKDVIKEYTDKTHLLKPNQTYHCKIIFVNGISYFYLNDELYVEYIDEQPLQKGYFAFRTLRSHQKIDNFKVYELE
jgi:hypothetical protein